MPRPAGVPNRRPTKPKYRRKTVELTEKDQLYLDEIVAILDGPAEIDAIRRSIRTTRALLSYADSNGIVHLTLSDGRIVDLVV